MTPANLKIVVEMTDWNADKYFFRIFLKQFLDIYFYISTTFEYLHLKLSFKPSTNAVVVCQVSPVLFTYFYRRTTICAIGSCPTSTCKNYINRWK